jgi:hypothetical protein
VIREKRYYIRGNWRYLMFLPGALALFGLWASSDSLQGVFAGGPMLGMLAYGSAVLVWGRALHQVSPEGFQVTHGPMPTGAIPEVHGKEEVRHLFPRYLREAEGKNHWVVNYYASVELQDGRWVNVRGPYANWEGASKSCMEIAQLWKLPEVAAGRQGFPAGARDWRSAVVVLLWGVGFIVALLWGAWVEISGLGR